MNGTQISQPYPTTLSLHRVLCLGWKPGRPWLTAWFLQRLSVMHIESIRLVSIRQLFSLGDRTTPSAPRLIISRTGSFWDDELADMLTATAIMDAYQYLFGSINILVSLPSCDSHTTLARCMQRGPKSIFPGHNSAGTCPFLLCSETIAPTANRKENCIS